MNINFDDNDLKYMWGKLIEIGQKKVIIINNSHKKKLLETTPDLFRYENYDTYNAYNCLSEPIKKQIAPEFFKRCDVGDITMILLNKGFNNSQINQILKAKEKDIDINKYLDKEISVEELRSMRENDLNSQ